MGNRKSNHIQTVQVTDKIKQTVNSKYQQQQLNWTTLSQAFNDNSTIKVNLPTTSNLKATSIITINKPLTSS